MLGFLGVPGAGAIAIGWPTERLGKKEKKGKGVEHGTTTTASAAARRTVAPGGARTSTVPVATDAPISPFERIPPEVLLKVLSQLDGKTLMASVPQVCQRWRTACSAIRNVHLDFSWWKGGKIPVEVLAGWRQTTFGKKAQRTKRMLRRGGGNIAGDVWKTGMCELFPRTTSITMVYRHGVEDSHLLALADK